jgi:tetratricopeptide (TPR) repeat protein
MKRVQDEFRMLVIVVGLLCSSAARGVMVSGQISRIGDATHLEFSGRRDWKYEVKKDGANKLSLQVHPFDVATEARLKSWSDNFIKLITIDKSGPDGTYVVHFELAESNVDFFDYQTDDPARLIIDFYRNEKLETKNVTEASTKTESQTASLGADKNDLNKITKMPAKKATKGVSTDYKALRNKKRMPAATEILEVKKDDQGVKFVGGNAELPTVGVYDGNDPEFTRFQIKDYQIKEEAVISSRQNIYLKFPLLKLPVNRLKELSDDKPEYAIQSNTGPEIRKENAEAQFLLQLFESRRLGAFEKTYSFFVKQYPNSQYDEIIRNLRVELQIEELMKSKSLGEYDGLKSEIKYLLQKYPDSPLVPRHKLVLGYAALLMDDSAAALQEFQNFQKEHSNHSDFELVTLAIAESYIGLNKSDDAIAIYKELEKSAKDKNIAVEAAYRTGDVYLKDKNFKMAEAEYKRVLEKYPLHAKTFPNGYYNMAESQFMQSKHKDSLNSFVTFIKNYPIHAHGGYALTRIGELLQILGADQSQYMGAFIESYYRFPNSPGAGIAKIRMLSHQFKTMKEKEKEIALSEIAEIAKNSSLPRMDEFVTLMVAEGLSRRGEYVSALDKLLKYYQAQPMSANFPVIEARILRNISDIMKSQIESGDFFSALQTHGRYAKTWLRKSDRIDTQYFQARAYELAGNYADAEAIYNELITRIESPEWKKEERKRNVYEHIPSIDELRLRLAKTYTELRKYAEANKQIMAIKDKLSDASLIEKAIIRGEIAEKSGDLKTAISSIESLIDSWKGKPDLLAEPFVKLGTLYLRDGNLNEVDKVITNIENLKKNNLITNDDLWAKGLLLKGEHRARSGQKLAAVESYLGLLDEFESKRPMDDVRFKAGLLLYNEGDIRGAEKIWSGLSNSKENVYYRLAQDKLIHSEWQSEHKRYLNRIPAAESIR